MGYRRKEYCKCRWGGSDASRVGRRLGLHIVGWKLGSFAFSVTALCKVNNMSYNYSILQYTIFLNREHVCTVSLISYG